MKTHYLKVVRSFSINGEIAPVDAIVEVESSEALDLLNRGMAEPATDADEGQPAKPAKKK